MNRYINDDAPITSNLRKATRLGLDTLLQQMIKSYDSSPSVSVPFSQMTFNSQSAMLEDLISILSYENGSIQKDISNICFGIENMNADSKSNLYPGSQGKNLCGAKTLPNGLSFYGVMANDDWELPVFYIIYSEGSQLRAYVPIKGNAVNCDTVSAFGSETSAQNINAKYNLYQLYNEYYNNKMLVPANASLDAFINDTHIATASYLAQYGLTDSSTGISVPNASDLVLNWDAINEEIQTAIQVI